MQRVLRTNRVGTEEQNAWSISRTDVRRAAKLWQLSIKESCSLPSSASAYSKFSERSRKKVEATAVCLAVVTENVSFSNKPNFGTT
jgi:hypothetical protein